MGDWEGRLMATLDDVRRQFRNPPADGRPMMRWWWFGPSVERGEIERQLRAMAAAGLGGVEVAFVYPMGPVTAEFGSAALLADLGYAARTARQLGLRFDLTLGSGWSYGGGHIGAEHAARGLGWDRREIGAAELQVPVVEAWPGDEIVAAFVGEGAAPAAYEELVVDGGVIHVPPGKGPREVLIATSRLTGQNVKRAAAGAEGPVLDHYSVGAAEKHIAAVAEPFLRAAGPELVGSVFCDSVEVYGADWTPELLKEFTARRGYSLQPRLWELLVDAPGAQQVRIDFQRTLAELYEENFVAVFQRWAAGHGVPFRIQSYGEPGATVSSYRSADLFEGEGWGWTRVPETRWAASAAAAYGRQVVSAEVWTWVHSPSFRATPLDLQAEAHEHFLSGVNQLIGHGWPYSPASAGWIFYAAGALDDRNPWWPVAGELFGALHRVSWLLQQGTPVRDVKVYVPASDVYAEARGSVNLYRAARDRIGVEVPRQIRESGLDFDLVDDDAVEVLQPGGLVVVPEGAIVPERTRAWLAQCEVVSDLAGRLPDGLAPDVGVVRRRLDDGDVYFLANTGNEVRSFRFEVADAFERWDAATGETRVVGSSVTLQPYESVVLVPTAGEVGAEPEVGLVAGQGVEVVGRVDGPWLVDFGAGPEPVALPHRWEDSRPAYSGSAAYLTEVELPAAAQVFLDFGDGEPVERAEYLPENSFQALLLPPVGVAAEVWVNDVRCGSVWAPPYRVEVTDAVRAGKNAVRVVVHNTRANALAADQELAAVVEAVTAEYGNRFELQDIEHAADHLASGLLSPPVVLRGDPR
ncbi:glycosyl hydrolase [Kribbella sp. NPDC051770]|uniref:glycosyl hydrolase n=1 Tax=Kribbella sp. NPDC051770 TaxID=3155413 RepID=UPI0034330881